MSDKNAKHYYKLREIQGVSISYLWLFFVIQNFPPGRLQVIELVVSHHPEKAP